MEPNHPRTLEKKREILAAAARVFRARGVLGAGMREIAAALDMHPSNLYYYFKSKEELFAFCQGEGLDGLLGLAERVRALPLPVPARLYLWIVGHVEQLNEGTPGALAHLEVEGLEGKQKSALLRRRREYEAALRALIEEGVGSGSFRGTEAKTAAFAILGAVNYTVRWFKREGGKSAREIGCEFAELAVRGLLAPKAPFAAPDLTPLDEE